MIKKIRIKLSYPHRKPKEEPHAGLDWQRTASSASAGESVPSSMVAQASECGSCPDIRRRQAFRNGRTEEHAVVLVLDGMEPGQDLKIPRPDGTVLRARVPPRSEWTSEDCDGSPRRYFTVPVPAAETAHPPANKDSRDDDVSCAKREMVGTSTRTERSFVRSGAFCQCLPSLGVYDEMCPFHGNGAMRRC